MDAMEARVRKLHDWIVKSVREPTLIINLIPTGVIDQVESTAIERLYQTDPSKATEKLVNAVLASDAPGKWPALIDTLKQADYPYLVQLLENDEDPSYPEIRTIETFGPMLIDKINPVEIVCHLVSLRVINEKDRQQIVARNDTHGTAAASAVLLDCIKHRLPPRQWYPRFLQALIASGSEGIVKEIDPYFRPCSPPRPSVSDACPGASDELLFGPSASKQMRYSSYPGPSAVKENVMEAYGDGDDCMDLEGTPAEPDTIKVLSHGDQKDSTEVNIDKAVEEEVLYGSNQNGSLLKNVAAAENWNRPIEKATDKKRLNIPTEEPELLPNAPSSSHIDCSECPEAGSKQAPSDSDNLDSDCDVDLGDRKFQLRSDQLELTERAVQGQNTIIFAETGTGKTFVAFQIVQKHMEKREGTGKVVFMACTGTLVQQQHDRFRKFLPHLQVKQLTGDHETSLMLKALLPFADVFCMTPQILLNNLERDDNMSLESISLLILDECHHTIKNNPYNKLMRRYLMEKYEGTKTSALPQVVGLTASLGVGKSHSDQEAMDYILGVCANLDVLEISTVDREREEAAKHVSKPTEENIPMQVRQKDVGRDLLLQAIEDTEDRLWDFIAFESGLLEEWSKIPNDKLSQNYFNWITGFERLARSMVADQEQSRSILACTRHLGVYCSALEVNYMLRLQDVMKFLADRFQNEAIHKDRLITLERELLDCFTDVQKKLMKQARSEENPNVKQLVEALKRPFEEKGVESWAMVFVQARATCKALVSALQGEFRAMGVGVSCLYGKEKRGDEEGMTEAEQQDAVKKFRQGHYKILVATSIGVEGIDIPDCNVILSYNYTGNQITKIQMSGRIRKKTGGTKINLANEKIMQMDMVNMYKVKMMYNAMKLIKKMDAREKDCKIKLMRQENIRTEKMRLAASRTVGSRKSNEGKFELQCWKCKAHACYNSDIRIINGTTHFVIDKAFADRIILRPLRKSKKIEGLEMKTEMLCKNCPSLWGVVFEHRGIPIRTLMLKSFAVIDHTCTPASTRNYKKWQDVPFKPDQVSIDDIPCLIDETEVVNDQSHPNNSL